MKIKNKLENVILKLEDIQAKKTIQNLMKKLLASFIITTNIFFYIPPIIFAESNDSDNRVPATVPAAANEIISKFVSVKTSSGSSNSTSGNTITNNAESGDGWDSVTEVKATNGITRKSNDQEKSGEAKIEKCNLSNGGYDAIFTSGTTGRQFKEYKQNSSAYSYPDISKYGCGWGSECGTVSTLIIGSGYTENATIQDGANKLNSDTYRGGTRFSEFLSDYTGQSVTQSGVSSKEELKNAIANGSVAVIHDNGYGSAGHYMAILDINNDKNQVYISNPDVYGTGSDGIHQGWNSIDDVYNAIEKNVIYFVTNDGSTINYGAGGSTSSGSSSSVDMSGNITEIIDIGRSGYKINVDWEKEVEEMLENLKKKNYKIDKYLDKSLQKEHLKNYLKAAIVTQYPDLRSAKEITKDRAEIPANETQGCIKIKRFIDSETKSFAGSSLTNPVDSKDNAMYLTYMPYSKFSELITNADKSALNYFSLDSSNNLVVAGWETLDVDVSIEQIAGDPDPNPDPAPEPRAQEYEKLVEKKINYVNQVSNYTMPFSYLWSLLVYGNDEDFVNDLAKLVIDTDIVIGGYDATNIKETTYTKTYTKTYTINKTAGIGDYAPTEGGYAAKAESTEVKTCKYKVTEQHKLRTDTPSLKVKYANTWTAIYNNKYKVTSKKEDSSESNTNKKDENLGSTYDYKYDEETNDIVDNDKSLQKDIDSKIEELRKSTSEYNQQNFAYRYEKLTKSLNEDYNYTEDIDDSYKLLHDEDVQNYLINMIINGNSQTYILETFKNNETIKRAAKKISDTNYVGIQERAGKCAQQIVSELETNNLENELTKNKADTRLNKTYSSKVTSVQTEEVISKVDQQEKIETDTTKANVDEVTTGTNNNVIMKDDKDAKEDNFVKLLYYSKRAKSNLKILDSWLFEAMEETAAIADMLDLTKYLFNCVYKPNTKYTKEQLDEIANLFNPEGFSSASNSDYSSGNASTNLMSFLAKAEGGDNYIDGDSYTVFSTESVDGCLNIGHGVVVAQYGKPWYPDILPNPYAGQVVTKEIYEKLFNEVIKSKTNNLDAALAKYGVTLNQNQYDAMVSYCYNCGADLDLLISTYKKEGEQGLWREWQKYCCAEGVQLLGLKRRRSEEYELFVKGDYDYNPVSDGDRVKYY